MKGIIGRKLGMTQVFNEKGLVVPVTVVEAGPCVVANLKTEAIDGYNAVVLGFQEVKDGKLNKPEEGLFKKNKLKNYKHLVEFKFDEAKQIGDEVKASVFNKGEFVDVSGTSRGRGFSGVIQRHNQHRLKMTHGTGPVHRQPGSMGANSTPSRIMKGKNMPGQWGHEACTVQHLEVVGVDEAKNVLLIKGAVPGPKGSLVTVRTSVKG